MPMLPKGDRYHHGDLRAALIETTVELIGERGVRDFSLAEASRRLGVAASAPYAHFADRAALLAAVAVHAYELFAAELEPELSDSNTPHDRLAAMARTYVRFAGTHRPLFQVLFEAGIDKARHPEVAAAERPIDDAFLDCVRALSDDPEELASAVEAAAHGHAMLLLDGRFGRGRKAVELAAERAAQATLALIEGRRLLADASTSPQARA
jgi:AcrR family transcriptional regulator